MQKKPKLLDTKLILISSKSSMNNKIIEQALRNVDFAETINETDIIKFLTKVFMQEPKLLILAHEKLQDNITYAQHVRNNHNFAELEIISISDPLKKESLLINKKISELGLKCFYIPCNTNDLAKSIKDALDK